MICRHGVTTLLDRERTLDWIRLSFEAFLAANGAVAPEFEPVSALLGNVSDRDAERAASSCRGCHLMQKGQGVDVGPALWDIVGRPIAAADDYPYSPAMIQLGGDWTYEALNAFIANPKAFVPGTKMAYAGVADVNTRAGIIAFLRQLSDKPTPLPDP